MYCVALDHHLPGAVQLLLLQAGWIGVISREGGSVVDLNFQDWTVFKIRVLDVILVLLAPSVNNYLDVNSLRALRADSESLRVIKQRQRPTQLRLALKASTTHTDITAATCSILPDNNCHNYMQRGHHLQLHTPATSSNGTSHAL